MNLATPNARLAQHVRTSFAELALQDATDLVRVSRANGSIDLALAERMEVTLARASASFVHSEFFFALFQAVDAYRADGREISAALRTLASCLLVEAVVNRFDAPPLPVSLPNEPLRLLSASTNAPDITGPADGLASAAYLAANEVAIRDAFAGSWLQRAARVRLRGKAPATVEELRKYTDQTVVVSRRDPELVIPEAASDVLLQKFEMAARLVAEVSPEQAAEVDVLTEYVVPLKGDHFVGGSDITLFGASFLRLDERWSPLCFADHVIHEASHQLLHARQEEETLLVNRDELVERSPIRADPRPLYGSFHATFVFLRLARFMSGAVASAPEGMRPEATIRLHRHLVGLLQGLEIIRTSAELTSAGTEEFQAWVRSARELVSLHGEPQADIYMNLDWDYDPPNPSLPSIAL